MFGSLEELFWVWVADLTSLVRLVVDTVSPPARYGLRQTGEVWTVTVTTRKGHTPRGRMVGGPDGLLRFEPASLSEALTGSEIRLAVPDAWVFWRRDVTAPARMMPFLDSYVRTGFEQFSPWRFEDCHVAIVSPQVLQAGDRCGFSLAIIRRALLANVIAPLSATSPARLQLDVVVPDAAAGQSAQSVTIPVAIGPMPRRRSERIVAGVLAALIIATTALLVARSWYGTVIANDVSAIEADIATEAASQKRLQDSLDRDTAARTQERQARSPQLPTFQIIEALSRILPDSVYLASIDMDKSKLHLTGTSKGDVASLIPLLERSPFFSNVSFSAPTTRAASGDGSHFAIELSVNDRPSLKPVRHVGP